MPTGQNRSVILLQPGLVLFRPRNRLLRKAEPIVTPHLGVYVSPAGLITGYAPGYTLVNGQVFYAGVPWVAPARVFPAHAVALINTRHPSLAARVLPTKLVHPALRPTVTHAVPTSNPGISTAVHHQPGNKNTAPAKLNPAAPLAGSHHSTQHPGNIAGTKAPSAHPGSVKPGQPATLAHKTVAGSSTTHSSQSGLARTHNIHNTSTVHRTVTKPNTLASNRSHPSNLHHTSLHSSVATGSRVVHTTHVTYHPVSYQPHYSAPAPRPVIISHPTPVYRPQVTSVRSPHLY